MTAPRMSKNKRILPQRHTVKGAPAAGAGRGMSFDAATDQRKIRALAFAKIGQFAQGKPWRDASKYSAVGAIPGKKAGYAVSSGKSHRDPATFGQVTAGGGKINMLSKDTAKRLGPSVVLDAHEKSKVPLSKVAPVRSHKAGLAPHRPKGNVGHVNDTAGPPTHVRRGRKIRQSY